MRGKGKGENRTVLGAEAVEHGFDVQEVLAKKEEVADDGDEGWARREVGGGGGGVLVGFGDSCYEFECYDEDKGWEDNEQQATSHCC